MHLVGPPVFAIKKRMSDTQINNFNIPNHVAIIMDGNGRWAKQRGKIRTFGHKNAIKSVRDSIEACQDFGIRYLTLFAFSTENWNRPKKEVDTLMQLLISTLKKEMDSLLEKQIKVKAIGSLSLLPTKVRDEILEVEELSKNNNKGQLTIALSYGSKQEIVEAAQSIAQQVQDNILTINDINEEVFSQHLYTHDLPDVDLLIRTSGEQRISNFLLWQIAYAELYFVETLWPDFNKEAFYKAIEFYQIKERRYGRTSEQITE